MGEIYSPGTIVYINGKHAAKVRQAWPEGSTSPFGSHYTVDFFDGEKNVRVPWNSVGLSQTTEEKS